MRTIRVISTQADSAISIESNATTWSQLKEELGARFSGVSDMKAIVRETRVTLESPEAQLPEGNFTIILSMKKIASGVRYSISQLREIRTKLNNVFADLLGDVASEEEEEVEEEDVNALQAEERAEIEELRRQGLL
jgi:hypothetical protein